MINELRKEHKQQVQPMRIWTIVERGLVEDLVGDETGRGETGGGLDGTSTRGEVAELRALGTAPGGCEGGGTFAGESADVNCRTDGTVGVEGASTEELLVLSLETGRLGKRERYDDETNEKKKRELNKKRR